MPSFKALIEKSPDVISLVSPAGKVLYASASSAKLFGYLPEELVGRNTFDLIHCEDRVKLGRAFEDVVSKPIETLRVQARVCRKDRQWSSVESTFSNLLDEPRVGAIVINYRETSAGGDPMERKQPHLRALPDRDADFEDFASAIANDLREPLRTISMFTELLVRDMQPEPLQQLLAQFLVDGVARMSALLDGLHSISFPGVNDLKKRSNLGHIVADAVQNLASAINSGDES
jgi:PAS domain S-box-containing protein